MCAKYDFAVVGGGIVGLSTGMALGNRFPGARILILEKENVWAKHQTGHNSGVIHSGIYYTPGSYKAKFTVDGNKTMVEFCAEQGVRHEVCGKVIVATKGADLPLLEDLYERGVQNRLSISKLGPDELKEIEPHVRALCAIRVASTGIVDYVEVCRAYVRVIEQQDGELRLGATVVHLLDKGDAIEIGTTMGTFVSKFLVNCAGLQSDRIAKLYGTEPGLKIVPFRGEYYELKPERRYLVKHLIYPVPNPSFPFLGVHFTRMISGHVEAGPNAVLAFKREGYKKTDFSWGDFSEIMAYKGFWKLARRYWKEGSEEMIRSFSKAAFVRSLQQLIPEIQAEDLVPAAAGIRAQALKPDGTLVDDFHVIKGNRSVHVCNAPSPAATASLEIGKFVARSLDPP